MELNVELLATPVFGIVAIGASLLAFACALVGSLSVLKGQSLIGDAMGHAAFPGVVLAFMLFQTRDPLLLVIGAAMTGLIGFAWIQIAKDYTKIPLDAALGIALATLFGLGVVLKSWIAGNSAFSKSSQAGLQSYIFGQASYMLERDVIIIAVVAFISCGLVLLFYKELKVHLFDPVFAEVIGLKRGIMNVIVLMCTLMLIAVGLKIVGAILISSMLIAPAVAALQWTSRFGRMLVIAACIAVIGAFTGVMIATLLDGLATGPCIIIVMSLIALVSLVIGPRGIVAQVLQRMTASKNGASPGSIASSSRNSGAAQAGEAPC